MIKTIIAWIAKWVVIVFRWVYPELPPLFEHGVHAYGNDWRFSIRTKKEFVLSVAFNSFDEAYVAKQRVIKRFFKNEMQAYLVKKH